MTFNIYTLGCKVNTYESNVMSDLLKNNGYNEVTTDEIADISIINTCTVTNTADNKSLKMLRQAIKKNDNAIIIVVGCLTQVNKEKALQIPGVDIVLGNTDKSKIVEYIEDYIKNKQSIINVPDISSSFETMKLNNFNKTRAFVKIQDGCNNYCAYCIIPYSRGNVRSKRKEDVLDEINNLINNGHKEIVLGGIHTGNYGVEFENYDFACLLNDLIKVPGLERLRISSIEITELNDRVLKILKESSILVDHLHIPLQSGCNKTLKEMNRKYDTAYFINKVKTIRDIRPNISLTTDVIVGFPNETDEDFEETINTIKTIKFTKLHVFPYSKREGTVAASMSNQVPEIIKKQRVQQLLTLSKTLEVEYMDKFVDKQVFFIPEVYQDGYLIGHTGNYLLIKAKGKEDLLHQLVPVTITKVSYPYCLSNID